MFYRILLVSLLLFMFFGEIEMAKLMFQFPRYHYKKKPRMENLFRRDSNRCESNFECQSLSGLDRTNCIRKCVSKTCYDEIYAFDELEEGEIDIRSSSFKGCWVKKVLDVKRY